MTEFDRSGQDLLPAGLAEAVLAGMRVGGEAPVRVMAVINVSPESFYAGSVSADPACLIDVAQRAESEGADILDVGAMSTAPYLETRISEGEERRRLTWALELLAPKVKVPLSADTSRAEVARAALSSGARILNDVGGLRTDPAMGEVAARAEGVVLMASSDGRGGEGTVLAVRRLLGDSLARAAGAGIVLERILLDPGIGFFPGRSAVKSNCSILDRLSDFADLGRPLLVGVSRKSFLGRLTDRQDPADRLAASLAAAAIAVYNGAAVIRAHDVAATLDVVRVARAIRTAQSAQ